MLLIFILIRIINHTVDWNITLQFLIKLESKAKPVVSVIFHAHCSDQPSFFVMLRSTSFCHAQINLLFPHAQINLLTAVMNDAPVLPDEDDEVGENIAHRNAIFLCSLDYLTRPKKSSWASN